MNETRRIIHVDINSYFATLLQQENPVLRDRPIGVVKSKGRTCIIAASKEAKKLGVKTGEILSDAKAKAPNLLTVPAQFDLYLSATHQLKQLFTSLSPNVHIFSLDEAFMDMTHSQRLAPNLQIFGRHIQRQVQQTLGTWVTCNVGVGPNKFLAKMAGEISPKGAVFEITPQNLEAVLLKTPFSDVCGIGFRLEKKLLGLGIDNPYAINLIDDQTLHDHFGPFWAHELRLMGQGKEPHLFSHQTKVSHMQSVGRTITGFKLANNEADIKKTLYNLLEEATYKLRRMDLAGRKIALSLWGDHGNYWGTHKTLKYWVRHTSEIFPLLFADYQHWHRSFPIIKFGVWIGDLQPLDQITQNWLPDFSRRERLYHAMDTINNRFGRFSVMSGRLLGGNLIHPEVTGFLGDKTYHELN